MAVLEFLVNIFVAPEPSIEKYMAQLGLDYGDLPEIIYIAKENWKINSRSVYPQTQDENGSARMLARGVLEDLDLLEKYDCPNNLPCECLFEAIMKYKDSD